MEKDDFASGTSSRSTKLIHGGVRYLQKAIMGLDYEQYRLVREALHERANLLEIAPHLSHPLPIMLPIYTYVVHVMCCIRIYAITLNIVQCTSLDDVNVIFFVCEHTHTHTACIFTCLH